MKKKLAAGGLMIVAAAVAFSNCWSPPLGSQQFLTDTCVQENSSEYKYTEYSVSNYFAGCAYISTWGCDLCRTRNLEIDKRVSLWQGAACTAPIADPGSWTFYENVVEGYDVSC